MEILITGGAGFIGSHISGLLLEAGHNVVVYDNLSTGYLNSIDPKARFIRGSLSDKNILLAALDGVDAVIHMAALIQVNESVKDPLRFAQNNILGSVYLLEAMKQKGVKKIVFSSSATVYGEPDKLPITEEAPLMAANPYGATKIASEAFMQSYHMTDGFDVTLLRYFNPYGPGELHNPESHAIPNFIKAAIQGRPIPLYWKGEQVRDFIYVEDLARAHIDVLSLSGYHVFNVGTEKGVKVKDVVGMIATILGKNLQIDYLGERRGDVMANYASSRSLHQATGWEAKFSLEEGLKQTIKWYQEKKIF